MKYIYTDKGIIRVPETEEENIQNLKRANRFIVILVIVFVILTPICVFAPWAEILGGL